MIVAAVESFAPFWAEVQPIFSAHYEELSVHRGHRTGDLDPMVEQYMQRDRDGMVMLVTLRDDGVLIGYFVGFVAWGLHYRNCLTLTPDLFYVVKDRRGAWGGVKLFREVEREARRRGVHLWIIGEKHHQPAGALFRRLGFAPFETLHAKWLEE